MFEIKDILILVKNTQSKYKMQSVIQTYPVIPPLSLITGFATFGSKNCDQAMTGYEYFRSLCRNFCPIVLIQ